MTEDRHKTRKQPGDLTYNAKWSGVSYAPHCDWGCLCQECGERLHVEAVHADGGNHYCPYCDDYVRGEPDCPNLG